MEQREVTDQDNTTWTCVQAYGGLTGQAAEEAADITENRAGKVPVVCTPSGGAQTVRLKLDREWITQLSDDELRVAITSKSNI